MHNSHSKYIALVTLGSLKLASRRQNWQLCNPLGACGVQTRVLQAFSQWTLLPRSQVGLPQRLWGGTLMTVMHVIPQPFSPRTSVLLLWQHSGQLNAAFLRLEIFHMEVHSSFRLCRAKTEEIEYNAGSRQQTPIWNTPCKPSDLLYLDAWRRRLQIMPTSGNSHFLRTSWPLRDSTLQRPCAIRAYRSPN